MTWTIEADEAYEAWVESTDPYDDADIRISVLEWVHSWQADGPPAESEYDPYRETYFCDVPGTPVRVEFITGLYLNPPVVIVRKFH